MLARLVALVLFIVFAPLPAFAQAFGTLALDAERYLRDIQTEHEASTSAVDATQVLDEGMALAERGDWEGAVAIYEDAVAAGFDQYDVWMNLAQALGRVGRLEDAAAAAYSAYLGAEGYEQRGRSMFALGDILKRANRLREAQAAYQTGLNQIYDERVSGELNALYNLDKFRATAVNLQSEGDKPRVCVEFYSAVSDDEAVRWPDYVKIEPAIDAAIIPSGNTLCIEGVAFGGTYEVTLLPGLPGMEGAALEEPDSLTVTIGDREPSVGFRSAAYVLPKVGSTGVPMVSVNVDEAELQLLRIADRNLVAQMYEGRFLQNLDGWDSDRIAESFGEAIWTGTVEVEAAQNEQTVTSIPIGELLPDTDPGIYILTARPKNAPQNEDWRSRATQWLVITDLGLTTYSGGDGLTAAVRSLDTGKPVKGVDLRLYARNNEELGKAWTDENGMAKFAPGLLRGTAGRTATALMAFGQGGEFSFIDLTRPAFDLSDRGVGGRAAPGPIDAFLYRDRGVYRPGETAQLVALLRDQVGEAIANLPLTVKFLRPDGVEAESRTLPQGKDGGFHIPYDISENARTGLWTAEAYVDPAGKPVGSVTFLVEEVVPRRIEVVLTSETTALVPDGEGQVSVDAKFLYGAPAANLPVKAELVVARDSDPYPAYPGYQFTLADETVEVVRTPIEDLVTDEAGLATIAFQLGEIPDTPQPLKADLRVEVYEFGGRPVIESLSLPVHNRSRAVGIKPLFAEEVPEGSRAAFELIAVAPDGTRVAAPGLRYELIREDWDYQWFYRGGSWDYEIIVRDQSIAGGNVDVTAAAPARLEQPVDWGRYRLEVYDAGSGSAASVRFYAGWAAQPGFGDTPDTLQMASDKDVYAPGETAKVALKPPFAGPVLLTVATDRIVETRLVDATPEGVTVEIPVNPSWGAGAYALATAFRPGETQVRGPGRAIGVAWLGIDNSARTLQVTLDVPEEVEPRTSVDIPVQVSGLTAGASAYVTLAAIDEGILQLTDFATPDPLAHYFGKRRLGVEIRDLYGQLIDGKDGRRGRIREGGDALALSRRGAPPATKLVAMFSGILTLDAQGRAVVPLDIPDYNGRLRLMAVAYDAQKLGSAEAGLVVRDPLVTLVSMPRFLAPGDASELSLSLQNLSAPAGTYQVALTAEGGVALGEGATTSIELAADASAVLRVPLSGEAPGEGRIALAVDGPQGYRLERSFDIFVRPAQLDTIERIVRRLAPGESLDLASAVLDRYLPGTGEVLASFSTTPNLDIPGVLRQLDRYPYGCLEQTVSRALPLLYVSEVSRLWGLGEDTEELRARVQQAINRTLGMQRYDGSFALWDPNGFVEPWLSAFTLDFMTRAKKLGYGVPEAAYAQGLEWLKRYSEDYYSESQEALGARAYALLVLSEAKVSDPSAVRYFYDTYARRLPTALAAAQLAAALALEGDQARAGKAFDVALGKVARQRREVRDYGSPLRDLAATATLMIEASYTGADPAPLIEQLAGMQQQEEWLSTQEQSWLLMAAAAAVGESLPLKLSINEDAQPEREAPLYLRPGADVLSGGLKVRNLGEGTVWARATVIGAPVDQLPPVSSGYEIERVFYDLNGEPVDLSQVRQTDMLVAVITGRKTTNTTEQTLIIDLLPPGFEVENPRLAGSVTAEELGWLPELSALDYAEFLDDRFVAAMEMLADRQDFAVAYLVRAVTPGTYQVPAAAVEAMYQPEFRARTAMESLTIVPYGQEGGRSGGRRSNAGSPG
jgi:hypothetical protein